MKNNIKKLPKRFNIIAEESNPLWYRFNYWLQTNKTGHYAFSRFIDNSNTKPFKGYVIITEGVVSYNSPTITLKQWDEIVNGFKLPKMWFVLYSDKEEFKTLKNHFNKRWGYIDRPNTHGYHNGHFSNNWVNALNITPSYLKEIGFKQITFKQFENHVLGKNTNKSIIDKMKVYQIFQNINTQFQRDLISSQFPIDLLKKQKEIVDSGVFNAMGVSPNMFENPLTPEECHKKLYTIEDLSEGRVAVINDGTKEELTTVLKAAFPEDIQVSSGLFKHYSRRQGVPKEWNSLSDESKLSKMPKQSVKEFYKQLNMKRIENVTELKVGDEILIEKDPSSWSSHFNGNCPRGVVAYPHKLTIKKIGFSDSIGVEKHWAMTCGNYGWSLQPIIDAGCVLINRNNKTENMDNRFPFELTEKDAKRIVDIACSGWKPRLSEKWGAKLLENGYVTIEEPFYKEMRKACTDEQHELFDEIFGKDEEQFKIGDWVHIGEETNTWESIVKLTKDIEQGVTYAISKKEGEQPFKASYITRKATPEEIAKAQCPYEDGELCWVKNEVHREWRLRYATGKVYNGASEFYRSQKDYGKVEFWHKHKSAKGVELPKD